MSDRPVFKRILLKLSGEALKGNAGESNAVDTEALASIVRQVTDIRRDGVEVALVVGGGNFFRGISGVAHGMMRTTGDFMGMMATVMNGLALRDAFEMEGVPCEIQSALPVEGVAPSVDLRHASHALGDGRIVVFAGGTGHPFFTTDTTAALRACEIGADALLKATKVDGVYSDDPVKDPDAERYEKLSYGEALEKRLGVMDSTAFSLCRDNGIKIVVFNFWEPEGLLRVSRGDTRIATVVGD